MIKLHISQPGFYRACKYFCVTKPEVYSEMWSTITSGKEWRGEFLNRKKNGDLFWEAASISPILNSAGDVTHFLGVKEDITDKKEATKLIFDKIIETEERERLRYSEELHDGLGPIISTIKLYFQLLSEDKDPDQRKIILSKANTCIDEAIMTIKEISFNLSPNVLNKFGLVAGIQNFISRLYDANLFSVDYTCNVERRFERNTEISIYRIITEMINNTIKYASASEVRINLNFEKRKSILSMEYSDNGCGFDLNEVLNNQRGLGMSNIYQRVNTLGGSLIIETSKGKGMKARIDLEIFN